MARALTPKQEKFVAALAAGKPQAIAYAEAGFAPDPTGGNCATLYRRLQAEAEARRRPAVAKAQERLEITAEATVKELHAQAFMDPHEVMAWDNDRCTVRPSSELTPVQRRSIKRIRFSRTSSYDNKGEQIIETNVDIEFADRQKALVELAKMQGLLQGDGQLNLILSKGDPDIEAERLRIQSMPDEELMADLVGLKRQLGDALEAPRAATPVAQEPKSTPEHAPGGVNAPEGQESTP